MKITEKLKQEIYEKLKEGNTFKATAKLYGIDYYEILKIFNEQNRLAKNINRNHFNVAQNSVRNKEIFEKILAGKTLQELAQEYGILAPCIYAVFIKLGGKKEQVNTPKKIRNKEIFEKILAGKTLQELAQEYGILAPGIYAVFIKLGGKKEQVNTPKKIREKEIKRMIKAGKSAEEIANKVSLSPLYIKRYYFRQKNKLRKK